MRDGLERETGQTSSIPEHLGDFRLLERLGAGGMGVVFRARDERLDREVALKLILPENLYFEEARERFRREVGAAAKLQHPGIVPVYSVGEEGGLPYFAMELVEGASLAAVIAQLRERRANELTGADMRAAIDAGTRRFDRRGSSTGASDAFGGTWVQVCCRIVLQIADALHHAHERGVLHRDVKPSNIVVTPSGRAMLLDFGIASTSDASRITRTGTAMGSLPYVPPECLRNGTASADRRADVYALGVSLYELLTLQLPFDGRTIAETAAAISSGTHVALRVRNSAVPWDAATVCATAMDRDPGRRYATAEELARDLRNLLELRPIEAQAPSTALRMRRWVQRRPTASVAIALGFLLLFVAPSVAWWRIREERDIAVSELAAREGMLQFLLDLFGAADPSLSGENRTVQELVDEGAQRVQTAMLDQPKARALLMLNFAQVESTLGRPREALELARQAHALAVELGGEHSALAIRALHEIAVALSDIGEFDAAREMLERVRAEQPRLAGELKLTQTRLALALATLDIKQGRVREGRERLAALEDAARGSDEGSQEFTWLTTMAEASRSLGERDEAERLYREACEYAKGKWGERSLPHARQLQNYGVQLLEGGRADEALPLLELVRSIRADEAKLESTEDARLAFNLAGVYNKLGRLEECAAAFERALAVSKQLNGDSPNTARAAAGMGAALFKTGRYEEAERALKEALELNRRFLPDHGLNSIEAPLWLARSLVKLGRNADAAPHFEDVLRRVEGDAATRPDLRAKFEGELADVLEALGRDVEAAQHRKLQSEWLERAAQTKQ